MAHEDDGVQALGIRLGAGALAEGPASDGGGQYYLVCEGEVMSGAATLPRRSIIHVGPGEAAPSLRAGAAGADVLVLQFARPGARPGSDPEKLAKRDPGAYMRRAEKSATV